MRASVATPTQGEALFIATDTGLWSLDRDSGALSPRVPRPDWPNGFRSNDGKVDPMGRLWWSAMDENGGKRPGFVHCYDGRQDRRVLDGVHIANAMAFSPDGSTYYLADSAKKTVFAYRMDLETGALSDRRVFAEWMDGEPDGAATDAEGFLWIAIWDGWRLERRAPDGRLDRVVEVPVQRPTACIFGGEDLSTLFVTSARAWLSPGELAGQPLAGSLFAFEPGVKGLPIPPLAA